MVKQASEHKIRRLYRITEAAAAGGHTARIRWEDGRESVVDLSEVLNKYEALRPHREDPELFATLRPDESGWGIAWADGMEIGTDDLLRRAMEQAGETISPQAFAEWMDRHDLKQQSAADLLGISRRMLNYYLSGEQVIPKTVVLAMRGAFPAESCFGLYTLVEPKAHKAGRASRGVSLGTMVRQALDAIKHVSERSPQGVKVVNPENGVYVVTVKKEPAKRVRRASSRNGQEQRG